MIKASLRVAAAAAGLMLSACGGGGGGSASFIPPPPQSTESFPLTKSASFETIAGIRSYTVPGNRTIGDFRVAGRNSGVTISYDAAAGSYRISDAVASATFDPTQRSTSDSFDIYTAATGTTADELRLYGNSRSGGSPAGAPISLSYLSFGSWSHDDSSSGEHRDSYFLFGYPTATSDMPKSGTASYSTFVTANIVNIVPGQGESSLTGSAAFTADFGVGTVSTSLTLPLTNFGSATSTYGGNGAISGNQFSGNFTTSDDPTFNSGAFAGGFFGPSAKEMGYTFAISRGAADPYGGAALQPPLSWIVGAVVGTKN